MPIPPVNMPPPPQTHKHKQVTTLPEVDILNESMSNVIQETIFKDAHLEVVNTGFCNWDQTQRGLVFLAIQLRHLSRYEKSERHMVITKFVSWY